MPPAKTEVALQFSECCAAETALQHWLFCSAEVIWTKSCAAANENCTATSKKLRCRKVALSCRFPAGFKPPRLGTHVSDLLSVRFLWGIAAPSRDMAITQTCLCLTNFCAPFFKEIPFFFAVRWPPSKTLAAPQPPEYCISSRKPRSFEVRGRGGGFRKEGDGGEGEKRRKKGRAKSAQVYMTVPRGWRALFGEVLRPLKRHRATRGIATIVSRAMPSNFSLGNKFEVVFEIVGAKRWKWWNLASGTGDLQRDSRESIRANHSQLKFLFL